jgi:hypothetical protein
MNDLPRCDQCLLKAAWKCGETNHLCDAHRLQWVARQAVAPAPPITPPVIVSGGGGHQAPFVPITPPTISQRNVLSLQSATVNPNLITHL